MAFEAMHGAAETLGWKLDPADPGLMDIYSTVTVTGKASGIPVRIVRESAMYLLTTTAFLLPPLPIHFSISHQGLGGKIANALGFHDVEIGDPDFDKMFWIKSKDPEGVKRLLTSDVKVALRALSDAIHPLIIRGFDVTEGGVSAVRVYQGLVITKEDVMRDIPMVADIANKLRAAMD